MVAAQRYYLRPHLSGIGDHVMELIPKDTYAQFNAVLKQRNVPVAAHNNYRKWLRYFLDFYEKYSPPDSRSDQVRLFIEKLLSKN